jgi:murein DD-endopeptidase MepM/ murein hydrolase activator NlpD
MYGVTVNTIMWANNISKATGIKKDDALVILPIVGVRHTVAKGETLGSIIKKYDANLDEVLEYNNLTSSDELAIGDELMIPGGEMHSATSKVASAAVPTKTSGNVSSGLGFTHPLPGARRTQGIHGYNGVDLAAAPGTPVLAAAGGSVIVAKGSGWNGGYGNYVVVKHKNTQTLYAHLSSVSVGVGDTVGAGESIGIIGNTGKSTGTHLHFEVRGGTNPF